MVLNDKSNAGQVGGGRRADRYEVIYSVTRAFLLAARLTKRMPAP